MLRVGLTGGLGSGKSTAAHRFAALGAQVIYSDDIGRELMQPGHAVYAAIVAHFGPEVVKADGALDRSALARLAFGGGESGGGRIEELNAIVHPATIARQAELIGQIAARDADAVAIVESALIFETRFGGKGGLRSRFDKLILVCAPQALKVARFVARAAGGRSLNEEERHALEADARRRIARQIDDEQKAASCDYVLTNDGPVEQLLAQVDALWPELRDAARRLT